MEGKPSLSHLGATEVPLREIHFWLSPEAKVGVVFWRPRHQSSKFRWDTTITRLLSLLSAPWLHPNIPFSLVDLLKYFISIILETLKKKRHSNRRARLTQDCRPAALPGCWGRSSQPPTPSSHLPHSVWTRQTLQPAWLITLPKNLWNKVHITGERHEGPSRGQNARPNKINMPATSIIL